MESPERTPDPAPPWSWARLRSGRATVVASALITAVMAGAVMYWVGADQERRRRAEQAQAERLDRTERTASENRGLIAGLDVRLRAIEAARARAAAARKKAEAAASPTTAPKPHVDGPMPIRSDPGRGPFPPGAPCARCRERRPDVRISSPLPFPPCDGCRVRTPDSWDPPDDGR